MKLFWESGSASASPSSASCSLALALGPQLGLGVVGLAVLAVQREGGAVGPLADVGRVLKEALLAALHGDHALVTGASGTASKVVRMPPLTESMRPARSTSIAGRPCRATTRSGSLWVEERR